ncbi:PD-(D/E)XK nuclease family protein [Myroides odoratimimus]|uniref:PD-(D/E)XK nuclease family protein n=1 Tax=Myroides odoratimimus TaxID=76832 RepID=UPI0025760C5B|nr:PD-(D/E)XK nuclease family protein [Myroides odoratimimus]MDM1465239.1 PD-(D/E)XK nuclease family protein [Myroides odoratimimus]MDM1475243.1 PD-(D/E)XK nuclease family protein [Myroides odoratimimus]
MKELQGFLDSCQLPNTTQIQDTFFSATKMTRREELWTNLYAFFFDCNAQHNQGTLFIETFLKIINQKFILKDEITLQNFYTLKTEEPTLKGGRIDLLIEDKKTSLIIENKVSHHLNNDLKDYYDSITNQNKIGIVLSIKKYSKSELTEHFINITHEELIQAMYLAYEKSKEQGELKYNILFEEFYKNVINESKTINMEQVNFYLNNTEKVNDIVAIKKQYELHIAKHLNDIKDSYEENFEVIHLDQRHILYLKNKRNNNLMITIVYDNLVQGKPELHFFVELQHDLLQTFRSEYKLENFNFDENEKKCLVTEFTKNKGKWGHFAYQHFDLSQENISNLAEFITNELNKSAVLHIYTKIVNAPLFQDKNTTPTC